MDKRIIFPNEEGYIAVLIPSTECELTLEEIATKDVPFGTPYLIVDVVDIPANRTFRGAWQADFSNPHGFGGEA